MDRGVAVVLDQLLRNEDRVLEVVTAPRHEGDQDVLAESQFAHLGGWAVGDDVAPLHMVADLDDRFLGDAGVLVGAGELDQVVDIDPGSGFIVFILVDLDHDAGSVDRLNHAGVPGNGRHARIPGHYPLHTGPDQRGVRPQEGNRLPLHVGTHQGAVGVVVFQERDE